VICPGCGALHFDGSYVRCGDCRTVTAVEAALHEKPQEMFILYGASSVKQPKGGIDILRHRSLWPGAIFPRDKG